MSHACSAVVTLFAADPQPVRKNVWFLVKNGGMDHGDYYWGLYRDYDRDPFPHSLLRTGQNMWPWLSVASEVQWPQGATGTGQEQDEP